MNENEKDLNIKEQKKLLILFTIFLLITTNIVFAIAITKRDFKKDFINDINYSISNKINYTDKINDYSDNEIIFIKYTNDLNNSKNHYKDFKENIKIFKINKKLIENELLEKITIRNEFSSLFFFNEKDSVDKLFSKINYEINNLDILINVIVLFFIISIFILLSYFILMAFHLSFLILFFKGDQITSFNLLFNNDLSLLIGAIIVIVFIIVFIFKIYNENNQIWIYIISIIIIIITIITLYCYDFISANNSFLYFLRYNIIYFFILLFIPIYKIFSYYNKEGKLLFIIIFILLFFILLLIFNNILLNDKYVIYFMIVYFVFIYKIYDLYLKTYFKVLSKLNFTISIFDLADKSNLYSIISINNKIYIIKDINIFNGLIYLKKEKSEEEKIITFEDFLSKDICVLKKEETNTKISCCEKT